MKNLLDSSYARFNLLKVCMAIPWGLVIALISYISYTFYWTFLPYFFKDEGMSVVALAIKGAFLYFSTMTYLFIIKAFISNPGYLPEWLKLPLSANETPHDIIRVYNMRFWRSCGIYEFEEFVASGDQE